VCKAMDYLPRRAADLVIEALADTRVVIVNGARQAGKSTLAEVGLVLVSADRDFARYPRLRWHDRPSTGDRQGCG
jgi:predicted AAA+ superfamily ATPase